MRPSSPSSAILFKLIYSRACSQITKVTYNLPRENNYHFLSRLTLTVKLAPSGMLSETTGLNNLLNNPLR